eukprot:SAG11_NODE_1147_length_5683_cov_40.952006_1_plen_104_part_00
MAVPGMLPAATLVEMTAWHARLAALKLEHDGKSIYEQIAMRLAKTVWRQCMDFDPKDGIGVAEATDLIRNQCVHIGPSGPAAPSSCQITLLYFCTTTHCAPAT